MKLKTQLLLLALLSLLFPITGWFALKSVDKEFRTTIEQASVNTLSSLVASVQQLRNNNPNIQLTGLIPKTLDEFILDGDDAEWFGIMAYQYTNNKAQLLVKIAASNDYLYLLLTSNDNSNNGQSLQASDNDEVIIALADERGLYKYTIQRQPEGLVLNNNSSERPQYQAYWHEKSNGYVLEIRFDNSHFHHLGFASIDKSTPNNQSVGSLDTAQTIQLLPIISQDMSFQASMDSITPVNNLFAIHDSQGRIIYQSDKLPNNQSVSQWQWIITPIYQWLFGINKEENNNWFYRQEDGMAGIKQMILKDGIRYELTSMMPQGQQSMIQTLLKAGVLMIAVVLLLMLAYLGYSLFLAWRIKKLNRALQSVLDDSGKLHIQMPSHSANDEIGELSRGIETMLIEMREYTQYLKDLGSRLSHEMKTPLAIVQSSLDNLELEQTPEFLQRAQDGTKRLRFILNQLSELSRLKYSLENTHREKFNLAQLCQDLGKTYQSMIPQLKINIESHTANIVGSKDLMAQLMDKIMDNAKDFTPEDGTIELSLSTDKGNAFLSITNSGSQLPDDTSIVFDSLLSIRNDNQNKQTHLGFGLYIAQLIAKYHKSILTSKNLYHPNRVQFSLKIKLI
jgi:signal transduction histidine kinase